ncbi:MAG TPA: SemiSWEET transporter [Terriglobales bacterium]|nr:SemiSWEET transporter [Terriglobales bacterium]
MSLVTLIGFAAGSLTTFSFLPQVVKSYRTKRCDDLSSGMLLAFTGGVVLWLVYGLFLRSAPIISANAVTLALLAVILVMKLRYRAS